MWCRLRHVFTAVRIALRRHQPAAGGIRILRRALLVSQPSCADGLQTLFPDFPSMAWGRQPRYFASSLAHEPSHEDLPSVEQHPSAARTVLALHRLLVQHEHACQRLLKCSLMHCVFTLVTPKSASACPNSLFAAWCHQSMLHGCHSLQAQCCPLPVLTRYRARQRVSQLLLAQPYCVEIRLPNGPLHRLSVHVLALKCGF